MAEDHPLIALGRRVRGLHLVRTDAAKIGLALGLIVLLGLMFPRGEEIEVDARVGAIWAQRDLIAPFSFPIIRDPDDYAEDVAEARRSVYPVFERDTTAPARYRAATARTFAVIDSVLRLPPGDSSAFRRATAGLDVRFTEQEWRDLRGVTTRGRGAAVESALVSIGDEFLQTGLLDRPKSQLERADIALRRGKVEEIVPASRFLDRGDLAEGLDGRLRADPLLTAGLRSPSYKIIITTIVPSIIFNEQATTQALAASVDAVPRTTGFVQENERIVSEHDRITPETKLKLDSFNRARADRGPTADTPLQILGTVLHVAPLVTLYGIYLFLFRKRIVGRTRKLALIALIMLLVGTAAWALRLLDVKAPVEYLIVVPAASMLLTIFFDSRVGFYGTVILSFIVAGIWGNDYAIAVASLVAGALSVYTVRDMKNRTQIFHSLGFIFLGYGLTILALGLARSEPPGLLLQQLALAAANAIVSPVLTYGLLIFIEKTFRLTTDLTLLELVQFNHPLLRLLAEKAPGTYHHSMTMASLAEAGAAAIGANATLARVGAYFHDVGKIIKPTYFVENQKTSRSRHDKLAPRMSSLIIAAHVKDGIALAREYNLPEEVIDFIPMHHGTTRMDYFYSKALDMARASDDETKIDEIKEQDYRYPGPRPQTRETGIMMLADAIEAAVRTIEEPTPQRITDLVDDVVKRRVEQGELDECPLTLQDITNVKEAFVNVLVGIYHTRVKYPDPEPKRRVRRAPAPATRRGTGEETPAAETDAVPPPAGAGEQG
jgi:hypothetical protein